MRIEASIDENGVIEIVEEWLRGRGFSTTGKSSTTEPGIDLDACTATERVLVEAKGATSSKPGSRRYGKPFSGSQVYDHVAKALLFACKLLTRYQDEPVHAVIALPDNTRHRHEVNQARVGIRRTGVQVWFVSREAGVRVWTPGMDLEAHEH